MQVDEESDRPPPPGFPTSGSLRTDLLTSVIAMDLFLTPSRMKAISKSYVANIAPAPTRLTADTQFRAVLEHVVLATHDRCTLELIAHDMGPDHPMDYELLLFPWQYNMAVSRPLVLRMLSRNLILALAALIDPRAYGPDELPAFLDVGQYGSHGELRIRHFAGDELLHHLFNPAYLVTLVCDRFVKNLMKMHPMLTACPALWNRIGQQIVACLDSLADVVDLDPDGQLVAVLRDCAAVFEDASYNTGHISVMREQFRQRSEAMDATAVHIGNNLIALLKARGPARRYHRALDPKWETRPDPFPPPAGWPTSSPVPEATPPATLGTH